MTTNISPEALLPCPFCGSEPTPETTTDPSENCHCIRCDECDFDLMGGPVGIGWWPTLTAATAAWNRRALPELQAAQPQAEQQGVPELFVQWLEREMPAGTVIGRPAWWAPKLVRALRNAERGVLGGCNG